jgi:hypothetical protein
VVPLAAALAYCTLRAAFEDERISNMKDKCDEPGL